MGFLKGLISLPVAIVQDTLTMGGTLDDHGRPHTMDAVNHLTGDDPESKLDRDIERAEKIKRLREKS